MRPPIDVFKDETSQSMFSPLGLRDRVVIMALFYEIATEDQVEKTWQRWEKMRSRGSSEAMWRILVRDPHIDSEAVYEVAAQIYGVEPVEINRLRAQTLMRELSNVFSEAQWKRMFELLVAPVAVGEDPRTGHARLVFATHDPTRPEVPRMLQQLELNSFELRYASPSDIAELFTEIFGPDIKHLLFLPDGEAEEVVEESSFVELAPVEEVDAPLELNTRSLVDWFESVLVITCREGASETHITINGDRQLEIILYKDGQPQLWRTEGSFHPEGLLAYVMDDILKMDRFRAGVVMQGRIQRWIGTERIYFNIEIHSENQKSKLESGTVMISVLGKG